MSKKKTKERKKAYKVYVDGKLLQSLPPGRESDNETLRIRNLHGIEIETIYLEE